MDSASLPTKDWASPRAEGRRSTDRRTRAHLPQFYPNQHLARKHADELEAFTPVPAVLERAGHGPGSLTDESLQPLLAAVTHEYKVTWNEPKPVLEATMLSRHSPSLASPWR
jgi:hypothetical protein